MSANPSDSGHYNPGRRRVPFTVALPVFNEAAILPRLHASLTTACRNAGASYEILYVDDGSSDGTSEILQQLADGDPFVTVVTLSRNFGQPAALAAAVELASGEAVIVMDADLQDDPSAIPALLAVQREQGADVVYVVRSGRREGLVMRLLFAIFHRLIARSSTFHIPRNTGSFGLIGPRALAEVRRLSERLRYFPGLRAFVGFKQVGMPLARGARYDQHSRVRFRGLVRLAGLALFSQSRAPVTLFYWLSSLSLLFSLGLITYAVVAKLLGVAVVAWASTVTSVAFFSAIITLGEAFICEYLARIYEEVRGRPIYIVEAVRRATQLTAPDREA
jgi:glycosyltransferase involved in cell wall biosynthesis